MHIILTDNSTDLSAVPSQLPIQRVL